MHYLLLLPTDQLVTVVEFAMSYGSLDMFMEPIITKFYASFYSSTL